jgi:hypothetical protein
MKRIAIVASIVCSPFAVFGAIKTEPIPELRPPRPELPPAAATESPLPWALGGVGVAAVAIAIAWPRRKPVPPPVPPFIVAQRELHALRMENLPATPVAVSSVVCRYVVAAFGLPASGVTSAEVIAGLASHGQCGVELTDVLGRFLGECDVAKFAPGAAPQGPAELVSRAERLLADLEGCRAVPASTP